MAILTGLVLKMSFSIIFLSEFENAGEFKSREKAIYGQITLGSFSERFYASTKSWSVKDYQQQWREAVSRLLSGSESSALITNLEDPTKNSFIVWWPMWRVGESVYIHNQLLFLENLESPLDIKNPYIHVSERQTVNEDGDTISEWSVPTEALKEFMHG